MAAATATTPQIAANHLNAAHDAYAALCLLPDVKVRRRKETREEAAHRARMTRHTHNTEAQILMMFEKVHRITDAFAERVTGTRGDRCVRASARCCHAHAW